MIDLDAITAEWLWQHLGEHVYIETDVDRYLPAVGVLRDVGLDRYGFAGFCATVRIGERDRCIPVRLITHYRPASLADSAAAYAAAVWGGA